MLYIPVHPIIVVYPLKILVHLVEKHCNRWLLSGHVITFSSQDSLIRWGLDIPTFMKKTLISPRLYIQFHLSCKLGKIWLDGGLGHLVFNINISLLYIDVGLYCKMTTLQTKLFKLGQLF